MPKNGAPDPPGMRGKRSRTKPGPLGEKCGDTLNKTIEKQYNIDTGMCDDAQLDYGIEEAES